MDYLWQQRHSSSDLLGTVINVHNGDWIRRGRCSVLTHDHSLPDFHYDHTFTILKCVYDLMTSTWLYNYDKHLTVFWELLCHFLDFFSIILFITLSRILILTEAIPWTVMASVGPILHKFKIFCKTSRKKKKQKKNCHPFNISIFSLAKFEFENPPKYEISMFLANLAFEWNLIVALNFLMPILIYIFM